MTLTTVQAVEWVLVYASKKYAVFCSQDGHGATRTQCQQGLVLASSEWTESSKEEDELQAYQGS